MPRRNHRSGHPQARRRADGSRGQVAPPPPPVERLIVPTGKCFFRSRRGKLIFPDEAAARKALQQAKAARQRAGSPYAERRVYACPTGGCDGWHLTSRETYQERTA